jgi:formylmethanofuran dehydrogenase subunit E
MNLYEFLNIKDGFIKINSNKLNVATLVKAFNAVETAGNDVAEIVIHPTKFKELQEKIKEDIFEGENIYQKIIEQKKLFGAHISTCDKIDTNIIQLNGSQFLPEKSVKLFIED